MESKIEIIDKGYAIIFVDHEGEGLLGQKGGYATDSMITLYYSKTANFIQWNFYHIVPADVFERPEVIREFEYGTEGLSREEVVQKIKKNFIHNDNYTRKFILNRENISRYINYQYPDFDPNKEAGKVLSIKARNHNEGCMTARRFHQEEYGDYKIVPSILRYYDSMRTLLELDNFRRDLIRNPELKFIYHTHLRNEYNFTRYKFIFLPKKTTKFYNIGLGKAGFGFWE
jgi:hypothetical protein